MRDTLSVQTKALIQMYRRGELDSHTCTVDVKIDNNVKGYEKKEFTFYKINNIYRAKEDVIRKHREYLKAKYNGAVPYRYDK